jgi:hypothetical protein
MKTQSKEKNALSVASHDAAYILEPLVDRAMAAGLERKQLLDAVAASAERVIRNVLTDRGLPVTVKGGVQLRSTTVDAEARCIAKKLIDRLTVKDPARVPPVAERHGLPAALAARAA